MTDVATIYFSSALAPYTGGVESLTVDAPRVRELLQASSSGFPPCGNRSRSWSIAVDGDVHTHPDYIPLTSSSEVHLVPRIAGGG